MPVCSPAGIPIKVPVGQLFLPPYLFRQDGQRAGRPAITKSPARLSYGGHFDISVAADSSTIGSVVLLRSDHNTHSLTTGDRYVKLAFREKGAARQGRLRVRAPRVPAQAIPGVYMLFVVDRAGVPSEGKQLRLRLEHDDRDENDDDDD